MDHGTGHRRMPAVAGTMEREAAKWVIKPATGRHLEEQGGTPCPNKDVPDEKRRRFLKGATFAGAAALTMPHDATAQGAPAQDRSRRCRRRPAIPCRCRTSRRRRRRRRRWNSSRSGKQRQRLHGRRHQVAGLRICRGQSGLELPRPARIAHQLRRQHEPGIPHLHPRGNLGRDGRTAIPRSRASRCCIFAHGAVGLQHASMALYNAWCDRVPVYMMIGNIARRRPCAAPASNGTTPSQDAAAIVRDYIKWDDYPASLQHFAEFDACAPTRSR